MSFLFLLRAEEITVQEVGEISERVLVALAYGSTTDPRELFGELSPLRRFQEFGLPKTEKFAAEGTAKNEFILMVHGAVGANRTKKDWVRTSGTKDFFAFEPRRDIHSISS